jgi:hypothetical protein
MQRQDSCLDLLHAEHHLYLHLDLLVLGRLIVLLQLWGSGCATHPSQCMATNWLLPKGISPLSYGTIDLGLFMHVVSTFVIRQLGSKLGQNKHVLELLPSQVLSLRIKSVSSLEIFHNHVSTTFHF